MAKKATKKNSDVLIGFVLDASGSMSSVSRETVAGFNKFVDEQREVDGEARLSLTIFNSQFDVRYVAEPLENVPPMELSMGPNPYVSGGNTALYDAVGITVKGMEAWLKNHPKFAGNIVIVMLTDGQENASHTYHIINGASIEDEFDVNNLINAKQAEGWQFVFAGSGQSAWLESKKFTSLAPQAVYAYTSSGSATTDSYGGLSGALTSTRSVGAQFTSSAIAANTQNGDTVVSNS